MKFIKFFAITAISVMALTSCSNDTEVLENGATLKNEGLAAARGIIPGKSPANGNWVVSGIKVFFSGNYRTFGNGSLPSQFTLDNSGVTNSGYAVGGRVFNGSYYILGDTKSSGKRGVLKLNSSLGGDQFLESTTDPGNISGQRFEVNFTLFDASTGYYTDVQKTPGKIYLFNPNTMVKSRIFDLTDQVGNKVPAFKTATYKHIGGKLLIRRGDKIFADVTYGNSYNNLKQVEQADNNIRVAVINARSGRVEKILVGANAQNIGLFNDHPLVNIDPVTNDIYFATVGNMSLPNPSRNTSQIFKIDGSNNLSSVIGYQDVIGNSPTGVAYLGEFNRLYVYGGTIYTALASGTTVRYINNADNNTHTDQNDYRNNVWEWTAIQGGTVTPITGIPLKDNFYAYQQPTLINGEIYFIVNNASYSGAYDSRIYKVTAGQTSATEVSEVKAGGLGAGWFYANKLSSINKL